MKNCREKNCQSQEALRKELFKLVGAIVARNGNRFGEVVAQDLMTHQILDMPAGPKSYSFSTNAKISPG